MSINKKILVFTATYNEAENISLLLEKILKTCPSADILVIDDNSPDSTSDIIEKLMTFHKNIFLVRKKRGALSWLMLSLFLSYLWSLVLPRL